MTKIMHVSSDRFGYFLTRSNRKGYVIRYSAIAVALTASLAFGGISSALAAKKMTYEDAYTKCREENAGKVQAEIANSVSRYTVMGGCMKKYGYRLKK
jgi:hypothetical protein